MFLATQGYRLLRYAELDARTERIEELRRDADRQIDRTQRRIGERPRTQRGGRAWGGKRKEASAETSTDAEGTGRHETEDIETEARPAGRRRSSVCRLHLRRRG